VLNNYVDLAFIAARKYNPTARLFYNDYNLQVDSKHRALIEMIKSMRQRNVPIDGVGTQMHVTTQWYPDLQTLKTQFAQLNALNIEIQITEMDVECPDPCD
jgi:endo-1,4-beta-xylanase